MLIRYGCEIGGEASAPTPVIARLSPHPELDGRIVRRDRPEIAPSVPADMFEDVFGNRCLRFVAPQGRFTIRIDGVIRDAGAPDPEEAGAAPCPVERLPPETLPFLAPSRYCESDLVSGEAWSRFGGVPPGWARAKAVSDFVHGHIEFAYGHARPTRTAAQVLEERRGVCRDFAHLAIAFLRALNMPTRYCTGYLTDIGLLEPDPPMDFTAWLEIWLGGRWIVLDPRNGSPRIGRILVARGRDGADTPLTHSFGAVRLSGFRVWAEEEGGAPGAGLAFPPAPR